MYYLKDHERNSLVEYAIEAIKVRNCFKHSYSRADYPFT